MPPALPILSGVTSLSTLYALYLHHHPGYDPKWTWLTVVGGNALIGVGFAFWLWRSPLSRRAGWAAFWRLVAVNVAAGSPIIAWQVSIHHVLPAMSEAE
jgi:hypothetical protein